MSTWVFHPGLLLEFSNSKDIQEFQLSFSSFKRLPWSPFLFTLWKKSCWSFNLKTCRKGSKIAGEWRIQSKHLDTDLAVQVLQLSHIRVLFLDRAGHLDNVLLNQFRHLMWKLEISWDHILLHFKLNFIFVSPSLGWSGLDKEWNDCLFPTQSLREASNSPNRWTF